MHLSAMGAGVETMHVNGEPGSGSPSSEIAIVYFPAVGGLKLTEYEPSPQSTALARTRVPCALQRMPTKNVSPPDCCRAPV